MPIILESKKRKFEPEIEPEIEEKYFNDTKEPVEDALISGKLILSFSLPLQSVLAEFYCIRKYESRFLKKWQVTSELFGLKWLKMEKCPNVDATVLEGFSDLLEMAFKGKVRAYICNADKSPVLFSG